jgi:hypothetical protein
MLGAKPAARDRLAGLTRMGFWVVSFIVKKQFGVNRFFPEPTRSAEPLAAQSRRGNRT